MTSEQISEWKAYEALEPFGEWRDDYRIAQLCTLILNITQSIWGGQKRVRFKIEDFMLQYQLDNIEKEVENVEKQSVEEMRQVLLGIAGQFKKREG